MTPGFIVAMRARDEAFGLVGQQQVQREHVAVGEHPFEREEFDARMGPRAAVPGDDLHAGAKRDAGDLTGDGAETDEPQRFAGELDALDTQPLTGAHPAIHSREAFGRSPHQPDGALAHGGVAIAFDDMDGDAALGELFRVHIAPRPGAEENDVLEAAALSGERRRHRGVVDDGDLGIATDDRELVRLHIGIAVDRKRRVSGAPQLLGDRG
jgi:hypothetical protein